MIKVRKLSFGGKIQIPRATHLSLLSSFFAIKSNKTRQVYSLGELITDSIVADERREFLIFKLKMFTKVFLMPSSILPLYCVRVLNLLPVGVVHHLISLHQVVLHSRDASAPLLLTLTTSPHPGSVHHPTEARVGKIGIMYRVESF